ncbi:MAG TPA: sialate O-acetylesterase [Pirellulales bacterium]|nr:sialate O-acetylesterase [Pirellulales bacterium]
MICRRIVALSCTASLAAFSILAFVPATACATVAANELFSDNAVLQQGIKLPVWGTADEGEKVSVSIGGQKIETTAAEGHWRVELQPLKAGGPFDLVIEGPKNKVESKNVLVGEVWIAGGQSNMEMALNKTANAADVIAKAANTKIHLITIIRRQGAAAPAADVQGKWAECDSKSVSGFSAVAYFFGRALQKQLSVPVGLINCNVGGTTAERWMSKEAFDAEPALKDMPRTQKSKGDFDLYNGMVHPLIPYGIRGAIWYQGESNSGQAWYYRTLFPAMIKAWRDDWKQGDFPFLFVQLAPYKAIVHQPQDSDWAELREAQLLTTLKSPNAAMAVITDVGEEKDIHPKRKQPVGERLALAARALAYGEKIEYSGPIFDSLSIDGRDAVVHFKHVGSGLIVKGDKLTGFTIAGDDKTFYDADAKIVGDTVVVSSDQVAKPVAVRFGWANFPVVDLWNKEDLPASPFRSDDFPGVTQPKGK